MDAPDNPFVPPEAPHGGRGDDAGHGALYTSGQVALATFMGSWVAGGIVLALNSRRLGRPSAAPWLVGTGIVGTVILAMIGYHLQSRGLARMLMLCSIATMYGISEHLTGADVVRELARGRKRGSSWMAAGIGLLCLLAVFGFIFAVVLIADGLDRR
jgi:hypothetical protein